MEDSQIIANNFFFKQDVNFDYENINKSRLVVTESTAVVAFHCTIMCDEGQTYH
jgi:hypothetical protein